MLLDQLMQKAVRLHNEGALQEAASLYQQILRVDPSHVPALYSLAAVALTVGSYEDAARLFSGTVQLAPDYADAWYNLGRALHRSGKGEEALAAFERTTELQPDHLQGHTDRAALLLEFERAAEALESTDAALKIKSDFPEALVNRGNALFALKRHEEALSSYDAALEAAPGFQAAEENRAHALFELGRVSRAPVWLMRRLFDAMSGQYDQIMLETLTYTAHESLRASAAKHLPKGANGLRILDLGCGTGLVGETFKDLAQGGGSIDGIDVSPLMLEAAKKRGRYSELIENDLEIFLSEDGPVYDLIVAADTMIYLGDLAPLFAGAKKHLKDGGYFFFTVEAKQGEGWDMAKGRFRHSETYMREEAKRAGFEFLGLDAVTLRNEDKAPVDGYVVGLKKSSS